MQMSREILLAAAVLATLSFVVSGFDFYKLSLQWPPSFCNIRKKSPCNDKKYLEKFTIHGLWPQLAGDVPVRPYQKDENCIPADQRPPTTSAEMVRKIMPIEDRLRPIWPNLVDGVRDMEFWQKEWESHGKCSEYPKEPEQYFEAAIHLFNNDFTDFAKDMGIKLGEIYKAGELLNQVQERYKYYPQFMCNYNHATKTKQLLEIRLCFTAPPDPLNYMDCPTRFVGECKLYDDEIILPAAAAAAAPPPPPPPGSKGLSPPPPPSRWPPKGAEIQ